jgi:D-glycero-D-manno-heptose 1,7-bisphosphate phosphatase
VSPDLFNKITAEPIVPVLYCDLDGTVRKGYDELGRFVNGPEDVEVFDTVPGLLWAYKHLGWRIVACSNQGGIALGHMTMQTCLEAMMETQRQVNHAFDKILWCRHHPKAEDNEMAVCWCRKPRCGMVIEAALQLANETGEIYPPYASLFVGDRPEDQECAQAANVPFLGAEAWRAGHHFDTLVTQSISD